METDEFLLRWFPKLPWTVIGDVCLYLSLETVSEILLKVPELKDSIIGHYYSQEIHLIVSPTKRPHFCTLNEQQKELIDIVTYGEIEDFLLENTEIVPRVYKVITRGDFKSMEILLTKFRDRLAQAPRLEIHIENYELAPADVELIFSFSNLGKFQTSETKLKKCFKQLSELLLHLKSMRELVFLGHEIKTWENVQFPPNLSHLDMSWYPDTDVTTVTLPPSLRNLYWNRAGINDRLRWDSACVPFLKTLMLTYNNLTTINVSWLPPTLETIDLSYNNILYFEHDDNNPRWPAGLKSILLNANLIDDVSMSQLSPIEWPPFLEHLRLDQNKLTSFRNFSLLPQYLKYLDLSDNPLRSFLVGANDSGYEFMKFPNSLDTLNLQGCKTLSYAYLEQLEPMFPDKRIHFPANLESLNLSECNIRKLHYFVFPSSLKTLSLAGNRIQDLNTYNLKVESQRIVDWNHMTHLTDLELYYNEIEDLKGWYPPESLRRIDLRCNRIKLLEGNDTPLFSKKASFDFYHLENLNLEQNEISGIDSSFELPRSLIGLNLSRNKLMSFVFLDSIASHENLRRLDLSHNHLERISIANPDQSYSSNLKEFNLSRNACANFQMSVDEFYSVFEKLGLQVVKRKHNIKSEHVFR